VNQGYFRTYAISPDGQRQIGTYNAYLPFSAPAGTITTRFVEPRTTTGGAWTPGAFNALEVGVGYHNASSGGTEFDFSDQSQGVAVYALTWEILVPGTAGAPPTPCLQLIDLSMARTVSGVGDASGGTPPGVDLSDAKFASGAGDEISTNTGIDLSDTLFASGAGPPPEE
jgi:hypothetical protein